MIPARPRTCGFGRSLQPAHLPDCRQRPRAGCCVTGREAIACDAVGALDAAPTGKARPGAAPSLAGVSRSRAAVLLGDGRPHPDTITRRFKKLAAAAGLPEIDLHDVRPSYATAGRDAKIDWKALSQRIGHADVAFTMKQYVQTDLEADRQVANTLAALIIGG
jgi:hypothetical protein